MKNLSNKKKILLVIISMAVVIIATTASYAWFTADVNGLILQLLLQE